MKQDYFYDYLHKQIPIMIVLSLFPGLGYVFLSWLHDIHLKAIIWYFGIMAISGYGYLIFRQYRYTDMNAVQLSSWYKKLKLFYYGFMLLWLIVFLLFIFEDDNELHYIAIFTEIGAAVVASVLLVPDKKLFKPCVIMLMVPLAVYFLMIGELYSYVLAVFSIVLTWVLIYAAESSHKLLMETNYLANHDYLTGLKNRYYFINFLKKKMVSLRVSKTFSYLLLIDLDYFKTINDSLGHDIGDLLLAEVSKRLNNCKHADCLLARLGGDEFVIAGGEFSNKEDCSEAAATAAKKILSMLKESYDIDMHKLYISASIGMSVIDGTSDDAGHLIKEADIAMYEAKGQGRDGVIVFDDILEKRVAYNLEVEKQLHFALEHNEISLVYQPQLNEQKQIVGVEALARWSNDELGTIPPDVFIPIAEQTGSIIEIGNFIMESAFRALHEWGEKGLSVKQFSINVSVRQFFYYNFISDVADLCETYLTEETRKKVIFEITESVVAEDVGKVVSIMDKIKSMGIRFSMDDFGTGYSSLSYLKNLPIDEIKIDRSFISELDKEENDQVMVNSVLNLAKQFSLSVVSEGIETVEQFDLLRVNECDLYQGYYFSKPLTSDKFFEYATSRV